MIKEITCLLVFGLLSLSADEIHPSHKVPVEKNLSPEFLESLKENTRKVYRGKELFTIGMPVGGVAAGQLYVRGDGSLAYWWIGNNPRMTGCGWGGYDSFMTPLGKYGTHYATYRPPSPVDNGFAVRVEDEDGKVSVHQLNEDGFDNIGFIGEYPIATVLYEEKEKSLPLKIKTDFFSPFIPLNAKDSALPLTTITHEITNTSDKTLKVDLGGWLQNAVMIFQQDKIDANAVNQVKRTNRRATAFYSVVPKKVKQITETSIVFDNFEDDFSKWSASGDAFGKAPVLKEIDRQSNISNQKGKFLNSFHGDDKSTGRMISKSFKITLPFINFMIGGGAHNQLESVRTEFKLVVDGKTVRSSTGHNSEALRKDFWDVKELIGKTAKFEVVDRATGGWGHILLDEIEFSNIPSQTREKLNKNHFEFGNISLSSLDPLAKVVTATRSREDFLKQFSKGITGSQKLDYSHPLGQNSPAVVISSATLAPDETKKFEFVLSWYFPNRVQKDDAWAGLGKITTGNGPVVGNMYANWFKSSEDVVDYFIKHKKRLTKATYTYRKTIFDSTLPYWFMHRISMPFANLATELVQWRKDGRFWGWEGSGCCPGTCGHVWNYAQGQARFFPQLEESVRRLQDFNPKRGYDEPTGLILFRGTGGIGQDWTGGWAADSMGGYIMKAYREHLMSKDNKFLTDIWPVVKKSTQALMNEDRKDGKLDGLLEGKQHNTYDIDYYGANTLVGSMYLGALKSAEKMALIMNDQKFALQCRNLAKTGSNKTMERCWNGEYFDQDVDLKKHPRNQYGEGSLCDQLLGQFFAHQLDLGHLYPEENVKTALNSIYKYNWAPDIAEQDKLHPAQRHYAYAGDAGMFICTWPKSQHLGPNSTCYRDEIWSGCEYQVAANLLYEGEVDKAMHIVRGVHDRYDGLKHNPWNEIECGDHYARALASWSCLLGASGFSCDGPAKIMTFAPKVTPNNFKSFYSDARSWGSLTQKRNGSKQTNSIEVKYGKQKLNELILEIPENFTGKVIAKTGNQVCPIGRVLKEGKRLSIRFANTISISSNQTLELLIK